MNMNDLTWIILKVAIVVAMTVITKFVIPALKVYIEEHKNSEIYSLIETAVRAAEQTITGSGKGSLKKEQVMSLVTKWLADRGIEISKEQLDQMVEECVYLMKNA